MTPPAPLAILHYLTDGTHCTFAEIERHFGCTNVMDEGAFGTAVYGLVALDCIEEEPRGRWVAITDSGRLRLEELRHEAKVETGDARAKGCLF